MTGERVPFKVKTRAHSTVFGRPGLSLCREGRGQKEERMADGKRARGWLRALVRVTALTGKTR